MRQSNIHQLEALSVACNFSGVLILFFGLIVIGIDLYHVDFSQRKIVEILQEIQVGVLIFVIGFSFMRIARRLSKILDYEKPTDIVIRR